MTKYNWDKITKVMRSGGYFQTIMDAGPEFNRLKLFLARLDQQEPTGQTPQLKPAFPLYPGLEHRPFHDTQDIPAATYLETHYADVKNTLEQLDSKAWGTYNPRNKTPSMTHISAEAHQPKNWDVHLLHHMGARMPGPTLPLLEKVPDNCLEYSWCDALFSRHTPGMHLHPHYSVDNLRVRIHLGINIPQPCSLTVNGIQRTWAPGSCLAFEDCYLHNTANDADTPRDILIIDIWHPDLTTVEREALTAGFGHSTIKELFYKHRLSSIQGLNPKCIDAIREKSKTFDQRKQVQSYWPLINSPTKQ